MCRYIVTGGCGFIGFHLCKELLEKGNYVYCVDNLNNYYDINLKLARLNILKKYKNFRFSRIDIQDYSKIFNLVKKFKPDKIIHLAAQAGVRYSIDNPRDYLNSNIVGFFNILEVCKNFKLPLVYASSSSVYGNNKIKKFNENLNTDKPVSFYAATKKSNEVLAHSYHELYNIPIVGLRFFTVYGPYGRPDMALFKFTKNILEKKEIEVYNNGNMFRDFTYIDDIIQGILGSISYLDKNSSHDVFNLGRGKSEKIIKFIKLIEKECNIKAKIKFKPIQNGDVLKTSCNISFSKKKIKFNPKINLEEGIFNFVTWFKEFYRYS
jgi:UDP-glucuronate 4-epimerase